MSVCVTDDGCRLAYALSGPAGAPGLVLSHSLGTDRGLWAAQVESLSAGRRVLRYDTRGHGASDAPDGGYTVDRLGRDVLALMNHAGLDTADVCGVSIGGVTALWLGVHAATRVRRLVLANTAATIGTAAFWDDRIRTVTDGGVAAVADATMARWFTPGFRDAHADVVAALRATLLATPVAGYLGCCTALRDADLQGDAAKVAAPTLVVTGCHDVATPPAAGEWLAATIPGARLVAFDAAHLANVECAAAFTAAVDQFLS
ncbi:MAG: 3-oxoadipate enol-lactonase [Vicinamibacterales bacterium]